VLAYQVGAGAATDAYKAAFQIPDLINYLMAGGVLSIAFIPIYARRLEADAAAAERLLGVVLGTAGAAVVALTALVWWQTPRLIDLAFGGFDADTRALTARLTRIVLPAQICLVTGGIVRAALMARGSFAAQAVGPLIYNAGIIVGGLLLAPSLGVEGFSWGCLAGAFVGLLALPLWDARRQGVRFRLRVDVRDADFLRYVALAAPLTVGVTLLTVDEWYDRFVGNHLAEGTIALLFYARPLMQVPIRVVGQATATAATPTFARLFSAGDTAGLNRLLEATLRVALGVAVISAAGMAALGEPVVRILYERGAFGAGDTAVVVRILRIMILAVPAWVVQQIAVRAFYAREQMWSPMLLGTLVALLAIPLYVALGREAGAEGLAAAGALAIWANALATLALGRVWHGGPAAGPLLATLARSSVIALAAGWVALRVLPGEPTLAGSLWHLVLAGSAFGALALLGIAAVGDPPLRDALARIGRRLSRRRARSAPG
jgi:putative peptidoglycan lipid II flippase